MACANNKIDSNITGLRFAEEVCLKQLPTLADDGFDPTWYETEPNSFSDFGGEISTVARAPIDPTRQNKKGTVTDLDASGGFNNDFVNDEALRRLLQGFFFADIRQKPTTKPLNATAVVMGAVTASDDKYATGANPGAGFNIAGLLVLASGFGVAANNGLKVVVSSDSNDITVAASPGLTNEATPPAAAKIEAVGYEFDTAEAGITKTGNVLSLTDSGNGLALLGLNVGERIYIGGDAASNADSFVNNKGYARIKSITAGTIALDDATFDGATEASTGKKIRIFFGSVLKNENTAALIKRRSFQFERGLGDGETAAQAEYIEGAVANELTLNIPSAEKMTVDMTFMACDNTHRSGEVGDTIKSTAAGATIVPAAGADAFNTTSDVVRIKMSVNDATDSNPDALFGYVTEGNISINNGVTPNKAVGVLGAFDTSAGNFVVGGSVTAYFTDVAAVRAVRQNADVALSVIVAAENSGFCWDIPLLGLGGGRLNVEKDQPIMVPLEPAGAKNEAGYTLMFNFFPYLPDVAMPQ